MQARQRYAEIFNVMVHMSATLHKALETMTRKHDHMLHGWNGMLDDLAAARSAAKKEAAANAAAAAECASVREQYIEYRDHADEEMSVLQQSNMVRQTFCHSSTAIAGARVRSNLVNVQRPCRRAAGHSHFSRMSLPPTCCHKGVMAHERQ